MTEFSFRTADFSDHALLIEQRLEVLRAANQLAPNAALPEAEAACRAYFNDPATYDRTTTIIACDGSDWAACGSICYYQVMPNRDNPSGRRGYIMNMYTREAYRRQGLARQIVDRLVADARARGVPHVHLEATAMGRPVYLQYGFVAAQHEMELP